MLVLVRRAPGPVVGVAAVPAVPARGARMPVALALDVARVVGPVALVVRPAGAVADQRRAGGLADEDRARGGQLAARLVGQPCVAAGDGHATARVERVREEVAEAPVLAGRHACRA